MRLTIGQTGALRSEDTVLVLLLLRTLLVEPDPFFRNPKGLLLPLRDREVLRKKKSSISSPPGSKGMERAFCVKA